MRGREAALRRSDGPFAVYLVRHSACERPWERLSGVLGPGGEARKRRIWQVVFQMERAGTMLIGWCDSPYVALRRYREPEMRFGGVKVALLARDAVDQGPVW